MRVTQPKYLRWIVKEEGIVLDSGETVKCFRIDYNSDDEVLDDWALHLRRHYIQDAELTESVARTGQTTEEYLRENCIPQKNTRLGSIARSADITEILISDLIEFVEGYVVPRCKQENRPGKDNPIQGTDVIGYKFHRTDKKASEYDQIIAAEVKAGLTSCNYEPLYKALKDTKKDKDRLSRTLDFYRKQLKAYNDNDSADEIARFQNKAEHNYKIIYLAAGVSSKHDVENTILLSNIGTDLVIDNGQGIFFVHGDSLMDLTHSIFERCIK